MGMIKCAKCGKLYDYGRYEGICPQCARYNRPDGRMEMEQEMHERYDSNPKAHEPSYHQSVHRANRDSYRHRRDEYAAQHGTYGGSYAGRERRNNRDGRRGKAVLAVFLLALMIVIIAMAVRQNIWDRVRDRFEEGGSTAVRLMSDEKLSIPFAWVNYLGEDMADVDWTEQPLDLSEEEIGELSALPAKDGYVYYFLTIEVTNERLPEYDLNSATPDDLSFRMEGEDGSEETVSCLRVFQPVIDVIERDESGYIDCLISAPGEDEQVEGTCVFHDEDHSMVDFEFFIYR